MFREDGKDITDEEFEELIEPFGYRCHQYLHDNILPAYVAFYLATGVQMKSLWSNTYKIHINSALDVFNIKYDYESVKSKVTKILAEKYHLRVISEEPLNFERIDWVYVRWINGSILVVTSFRYDLLNPFRKGQHVWI